MTLATNSPIERFNHTKRSWLVIWEASVVIELPPWTLLLYPSSLLYHFNIDIDGEPRIQSTLSNRLTSSFQG